MKTRTKLKARCKVKFRFNANRFDVGSHYAARIGRKKVVGIFGRRSTFNSKSVILYVPVEEGTRMKPVRVPRASIIPDAWAAVHNLQREAPPRCVVFKPQSVCDRRYVKLGGQSKIKGRRVLPKSKAH
jgi:hypothetical protein